MVIKKKKRCKPGDHLYMIQPREKAKNGVPQWICSKCGDVVYSN